MKKSVLLGLLGITFLMATAAARAEEPAPKVLRLDPFSTQVELGYSTDGIRLRAWDTTAKDAETSSIEYHSTDEKIMHALQGFWKSAIKRAQKKGKMLSGGNADISSPQFRQTEVPNLTITDEDVPNLEEKRDAQNRNDHYGCTYVEGVEEGVKIDIPSVPKVPNYLVTVFGKTRGYVVMTAPDKNQIKVSILDTKDGKSTLGQGVLSTLAKGSISAIVDGKEIGTLYCDVK